jgi:hypothetical protein
MSNIIVCVRYRTHIGRTVAVFETARDARAWLALEGFRPLEGMLFDKLDGDRQIVVEIIDND